MIDYFADDSKMCQVNELHGLAKKLKREQNATLVERTKQNESKQRLESEAKAGKESIEHALGFRSEGQGVDLNLCSSNFSDDEVFGIFHGLGEFGKATGSHGKLYLYYQHKLKQRCMFLVHCTGIMQDFSGSSPLLLQSSSSEEDDIPTETTNGPLCNQRHSGHANISLAASKPAASRISHFSRLE